MAYTRPQVQVFQEFLPSATPGTAPRAALIVGPHGRLFRYAVTNEKAEIGLGDYDPLTDTPYDWPARPPGGLVDQGYAKLFVDGALLLYYSNLIGSGGLVTPVSGRANRVHDAVTAFADHGADYPKSASMLDRGALVGDTVHVRGTDGSDTLELWTTIRGFVGEPVGAVTGSATSATSNAATQTAATSVDRLGIKNAVIITANGDGYDGRADGDVTETYTVEVTQGSTGSDFTTARLRVTSASGRDDVASVTPAPAGGATDIGTRGLYAILDLHATTSASSAAGTDDVSPNDLVVGHVYRIRVKQAVTAITATSGGTYTGTKNTTYIVDITRGGAYAGATPPQITVSTTTGVDFGPPINVTAAATTFAVGSYNVTVSFGGTGLIKRDRFYVVVTAGTTGLYQTIVLADDLPEGLQTATDLDLELYIKKDIQVPQNQEPSPPNQNFSTTDTQVTVAGGITLFDDEWTDAGDLVALELQGGSLFVEYRVWLPDFVGQLGSLSTSSQVSGLLGIDHPDNPLGYGVLLAVSNSNGQTVRFIAVSDPSSDAAWSRAFELARGRTDVYNIVPMSSRKEVQDLAASLALADSAPDRGAWKGAALATTLADSAAILNAALSSDGEAVLAKLADDPDTSGTQYSLLSVPAGNAKFLTKGVRAGDTVRYLFTTDGFGSETYDEFTIDEVLSESSLRLTSGHISAITVAQRVEVWRDMAGTDAVAALVAQMGQQKDRRVIKIANPTLTNGGLEFPGYFGAAAVAGLRSGVNPHQNLTHVTLIGIDGPGTLLASLNAVDYDSLAEAGGWVIAQDQTGAMYNYDATTTDPSDTKHKLEVIRVNVDSLSYSLRQVLLPFIGKTNITPDTITAIDTQLRGTLTTLQSTFFGALGPQLLNSRVIAITQSLLQRDKLIITIALTVPFPVDNIDLQLII